jgi:hypothetical protein
MGATCSRKTSLNRQRPNSRVTSRQIGERVKGEVEAAGVAQHVRVDRRQLGPFRGHANEVVHGLPRERLLALRHKEPGQRIRPDSKIAFDGSKLIASDRMLDCQAILEPLDPKPRMVDVDLVTAEADRLTDTQTMTKHRENEKVIGFCRKLCMAEACGMIAGNGSSGTAR